MTKQEDGGQHMSRSGNPGIDAQSAVELISGLARLWGELTSARVELLVELWIASSHRQHSLYEGEVLAENLRLEVGGGEVNDIAGESDA